MFEDEPEKKDLSIPPKAVDTVANFLRTTKLSKPRMFSSDPRKAAQYWISLQEQENERTEACTPRKKHDVVIGWNTPYHDRLIHRLKQFMRLKHIHKVFIIDMTAAGLYWRGESIDECIKLLELFEEQKKVFAEGGREAYIDNIFQSMKKVKGSELPYDKDIREHEK